MNSETPRTEEALVYLACIIPATGQVEQRSVIMPKFARELERELESLKAEREVEELKSKLGKLLAPETKTL